MTIYIFPAVVYMLMAAIYALIAYISYEKQRHQHTILYSACSVGHFLLAAHYGYLAYATAMSAKMVA